MSAKYQPKRIHIKPADYIAKYEEYDEASPSYVAYYTEPVGEFESNEISDTVYHANDEVPYHEHERGMELFLVDAGRVEVWIRGKRAVAVKGDMVFVPPYVAHGFRYLDDGTIWRELFQEIQMNPGLLQHHRLRYYHPEAFNDPEFMAGVYKRDATVWFDYKPMLRDVDKSTVGYIRDYDFALARFDFEGISLLQKVARYETNGHKEIWQARMKPGFNLSWGHQNPHTNLFVIYSGSVDVKIEGMEPFVANERDILNVPTYLAGEITTREDTVLLDYNCRGHLFRALDEITSLAAADPKAYKDPKVIDEILTRCDCFIRGSRP
jgi:mannose-6-phosphate isomerase-like protein (cupin superfamily)